jgi:hypothetical protein
MSISSSLRRAWATKSDAAGQVVVGACVAAPGSAGGTISPICQLPTVGPRFLCFWLIWWTWRPFCIRGPTAAPRWGRAIYWPGPHANLPSNQGEKGRRKDRDHAKIMIFASLIMVLITVFLGLFPMISGSDHIVHGFFLLLRVRERRIEERKKIRNVKI